MEAAANVIASLGLAAVPRDPEDEHLLRVARKEFIAHGFRRTAVGDIARKAKVSRPTVYRRIGDKNQIVRTVVLDEVLGFFSQAADRFLALPSATERMVEAFVAGVVEFRRNPVAQAVLRHEPEALLALVTGDRAESMEAVRDAVAVGLLDSALPAQEARQVAELILRITASLLLAPSQVMPIRTADEARSLATTYFVPLLEAAERSAADG